ncbi:NAD(P)-dependent oxidoreductase [Motilimonas cestriensis]|uniref:NAD(P)-dependent oxidoreductase n=1 Tax=Motilimonas cestriensis TaxID=2742685 RepID=A0ABS8W7T5_9GAMM|nr:NAD(P)-dependent oxidoreductase [Motilimonas cestriensis]MCE2594613.1 NAD(P)-dependent oxidoreductase [Motilimonas cestriensis]
MKLAFIGLGVMGYPMAGHLQQAGHQVTVYNRTTSKAEAWAAQYQSDFATTPAQATADADIVLMCVGNDQDVRAVVYGENGILAGMKSGALLVDHTTTSAALATELAAACHDQDKRFLDAPVSGGQAGAENACLTIMCGGEQRDFDFAKSILAIYSKSAALLGGHGAGQKCKMVNQICIAGLLQGLSEGIHFAQQAGLDVEQVIDVIKHGAAQSWQMENRASTMAQNKFDFGFAIDWMRKDLGFCLAEAKQNGAQLPVTELVDSYYGELQQQGEGRSDTSVLIKRLTSK